MSCLCRMCYAYDIQLFSVKLNEAKILIKCFSLLKKVLGGEI